jgi:eukaryotic-like serine/threonine-protein kinase
MGSGGEGGESTITVSLGPPAPPADGFAFAAGDRIGGRYRIVRFLAGGAMGEVYAAEDGELGAIVALKTVRSERAANEAALARFRREVLLARELTHPGICRIFDIGVHEGAAGRLLFFTMELLAGETLAQRLQRGRLAPSAARALADKLAAALAVAHASGVIHRDLKPANIMLVPDERAPGGERVVITDFGLARRTVDGEEASTGQARGEVGGRATATGVLLGSPAYMAPEQVRGGRIGPAADIYALGVVLFEVVTGRLPFGGDSPLEVAGARLERDAPRALSIVPDLDPRWDEVLARCLARDPARRFARVEEIPRALDSVSSEPSTSAGDAPPSQPAGLATATALARGRGWRRAAAVVALLAAGAGGWAVLRGRDEPADRDPGQGALAPTSNAPVAPLLAVVPLRNLSGRPESAWLGTAVAEMLGTELGAGERLRVVPGEAVAAAARAHGVALDGFELRTAALGQALAADYVVTGSVVAVGEVRAPRVRIELRVSRGAGAPVAQLGADGAEAELFDIIARLGADVRARLGKEALSPAERSAATGSQPSNLQAAHEFADGIAALRRNEAQTARAHFERAIQLEPASAKYHDGLASAWRALQFPEKTRQSAERAFALSLGLPRAERLFIEARHHEAARRFDQAIELYAALAAFFPENIEYRLTLADVQSAAGRPRDALATVDRLRASGVASDARVDVLEARAARAVGDDDRAQRAALSARERARAAAAPAMEAQAELAVCDVMGGKQLDQARAACIRAGELSDRLGDRAAVARSLVQLALVRERQSARDEALQLRDRALGLYREIGNLRGVGQVLSAQGISLKSAGKLDEALALQREALAVVREAGDDYTAGIVLGGIASTFVERGELEQARTTYLEVIEVGRRVGNERGVAIALQNLAWVERDSGELLAARRHAEESMAVQERRGEELDLVFSLDCAGIMALEQDDTDAAEKLFQRALALRDKLTMKKVATLQNLAEVRLIRRQLDEARRVIGESLTAATAGGLDEGFAREVESRILLEARDFDGAARALARARELTGERMRVPLDVDEARLLVARGQPRRAMAMMPAAIAHARKNGAVALRMAAEAALGEAEVAAGVKSGAARLAAIEKEASSRGYALTARLVAELRGERATSQPAQRERSPGR